MGGEVREMDKSWDRRAIFNRNVGQFTDWALMRL